MMDVFFMERDPYAPIRHCYPVDKVLYKGKSPYQEIMVIESPHFGKVLVLDGVAQCDEKYEFIYHEFMAHVPLHAHPNPETVLIVGGGRRSAKRSAKASGSKKGGPRGYRQRGYRSFQKIFAHHGVRL